MRRNKELCHLAIVVLMLVGCTASRKGQGSADGLQVLLADSALRNAHVGVLVQDAETGRLINAHQADKYFVPASNTKLWTMYAGLKYLGDSLVAGYLLPENDSVVWFRSNGDPTFLHPDYAAQPLAGQLGRYKSVLWQNAQMRTTEYGNGWSWNDYDATYMAPRSSMPLFGNVATFFVKDGSVQATPVVARNLIGNAEFFRDTALSIFRKFDDPYFTLLQPGRSKRITTTLFLTPQSASWLAATQLGNDWYFETPAGMSAPSSSGSAWKIVHSQPTDSMLKPLMHRSDNFFAEQTLLMVSQQWKGYMDERTVIDSMLRTDLRDLPQKPRWVDGSGLSRYNLFSPADYVWLLNKMRQEFPMQRMQSILPTGNTGTLTNYYKSLSGKIFAKTGTLEGVVALSGYLYAKSGRLLLFSVLVNNHNGSAPAVRRAVEKYLLGVWENH